METIEYNYSEIGTLVPVRGIVGNNKIVVLVNGMRVNPPGGDELNLHALYHASDKLEVFADLRNITHHKYALRGARGPLVLPPLPFPGVLAIPEETFRGVLGLRYSF